MATHYYSEKHSHSHPVHTHSYHSAHRARPLYRAVQAVWYALYVIEALLAMRFVFRLLEANPGSPIVDLVYAISGVFLAPFRATFPIVAANGNVLEWSTLFAMALYWLLAIGIVKLIHMAKPVTPIEAEEHLEHRDRL